MKKVAFFLFFSSFLFVNLHALECSDLAKKESFKTTPNELAYANEGLFYCDGSLLNLKEVKGKLISGKKVILVEDSNENFALIEQILSEITALANLQRPPKFAQGKFCANCAYSGYCVS